MLMALFCRSIVSNFPLPRLPLQLVPLNTTTPFPHCPSKSYQITALPLVLRCKTASFASLPSSPPPPPSSTMENPPEGYRRNVGICLMNPSNKKIFAASRLDIPSAWQMPQGGVDDNEDPTNAAIRELREETGVTSAEIVAEVPHWVTYDFPPDVREKLRHQWGSDWKGQAQKWFLFKFTGKDEEINLLGDGTEKAEFGEWSWISPEQVIELVSSGFQEARLQGSSICFLATFSVVKLVISEVRSLRGVEVDSKKENSDGVFVVPGNNAFGNSFRNYSAETERQKTVRELYRQSHINQTYDFVKKMREEYEKVNKVEMSIWECCELLNEVVDDSDPDLDEPQIEHLLQTAEAIRKDYPNEDWLHLTGLIHDLGKVLLLPSFGGLPQWAVVGDTFPLGCAFDESIVLHEVFFFFLSFAFSLTRVDGLSETTSLSQLKGNHDNNNPSYNTKYGVYSEGCGLNNVVMSWGHDDYMYLVAKANKTTLPSAALFIIRYHSFYPLHKSGAYTHLMNEEDHENLKWLQIFSKYDLYSKSNVRIDVEKVKPYYMSLIEKYFPAKLKW
ncbi:hypothetical protein MTR67_047085 [Solanum verrucosum]|uniref:inositol oxygenase n=1 Tax=Solanum verrucosum TaxID=315347 RepID=A0AAF0UX63_SOLVR|nr:hypothetical protein MTR67_047085 [Solanum verrucosum]